MTIKRLTIDEAITMGTNSAKHQLNMFDQAFSPELAAAFAGGLATGARNWVAEKMSARAAYELCQGLADQCVEVAQ